MWSLIIKQRLWKCFSFIMTGIRPKRNNTYLFWLIQQMVLSIYPIYFIMEIVNSDKIVICSHLIHTKLWGYGLHISLLSLKARVNVHGLPEDLCPWQDEGLKRRAEGGSAGALPLAAHSHHHPPPPDEAIRYPRPATQGAIYLID